MASTLRVLLKRAGGGQVAYDKLVQDGPKHLVDEGHDCTQCVVEAKGRHHELRMAIVRAAGLPMRIFLCCVNWPGATAQEQLGTFLTT